MANVSARQRFIDRAAVQRLFDAAGPTWRTIIALARFGGLRCPSEVLSLEWRHIDWERSRVTVPSPKTDRYDGKASRPSRFRGPRPFLEEAFELAAPGQTHVVGGGHLAKATGRTAGENCNLRTRSTKLVKRAGLEPWPRLFHNLRSSRETELLEMFPVHVVAQWMGHDAKVCLKHYAQTTEDHFDRAAASEKAAHQGRRIQAQQLAAGSGGESHLRNTTRESGGLCATSRDTAHMPANENGGGGGSRTRERLSALSVFKTDAIGRSATPPDRSPLANYVDEPVCSISALPPL